MVDLVKVTSMIYSDLSVESKRYLAFIIAQDFIFLYKAMNCVLEIFEPGKKFV